mmetsp:Transcript_8614/g.25436  ORF Transcript_8614/g.25436 Transcript_8614/m.25436 type:complete len:258 (+) Transcript_8614:161-934(+)
MARAPSHQASPPAAARIRPLRSAARSSIARAAARSYREGEACLVELRHLRPCPEKRERCRFSSQARFSTSVSRGQPSRRRTSARSPSASGQPSRNRSADAPQSCARSARSSDGLSMPSAIAIASVPLPPCGMGRGDRIARAPAPSARSTARMPTESVKVTLAAAFAPSRSRSSPAAVSDSSPVPAARWRRYEPAAGAVPRAEGGGHGAVRRRERERETARAGECGELPVRAGARLQSASGIRHLGGVGRPSSGTVRA